MTTATLTAREMNLTPLAYHAEREHVNHSALEVFRQSAARYHAIYVAGMLARDPPSAAMQLGSALHAKLLQPETFDELVAIAPDLDRRSNANKAFWAKFEADNAGKTIIKAADQLTIIHMAQAVMAHDMAGDLLSADGICERAIRWEDAATGLPLKALLDKRIPGGRFVVDLKTSSDPSPEAWAKSAANFGYHRQGAHYLDGATAVYGGDWTFLHIVVGSEEPHDVGVFELEPDAIRLGRQQNAADLAALKQCVDTGIWKHTWQAGIASVRLPRWAYTQ